MAYQFFAKAPGKPSSSSPVPPRQTQGHPPIHPPALQPPKSAVAKPRPVAEPFEPYPHAIPAGYATSHPHVTVETVGTAHIPSLTRITGLLLPIRYPNSFYTATITDPVIASLSRVAIYHDHPVAAVPDSNTSTEPGKVIGGIRCRLERQDPAGDQSEQGTTLYIQTLHLLSPYRGYGVAAALLNSLLFEVSPGLKKQHRVSQLVKHYHIRRVTAHVHETNEDGLRWYTARGFEVQEGVVEGYYRRLNPSGARIVKLDLEWQDENEQADVANNKDEEVLQSTTRSDPDDEDWEKVEAKDGDEGDHGVQPLPDSQSFDENTPSKKRKAEDEKGNAPQRR